MEEEEDGVFSDEEKEEEGEEEEGEEERLLEMMTVMEPGDGELPRYQDLEKLDAEFEEEGEREEEDGVGRSGESAASELERISRVEGFILWLPFLSGVVRWGFPLAGWWMKNSLSVIQVVAWEAVCSLLVVESAHVIGFGVYGFLFLPVSERGWNGEHASAVMVAVALDSVVLLWVITCFIFCERASQ